MRTFQLPLTLLLTLFPFLVGCPDSGERFDKVELDPAAVAKAVMEEYDGDGDGEVSKAELKKCRGLEMLTFAQEQMQPEYRLDQDSSGTITESEFEDKFRACFKDKRQAYSCRILYKGRPLPGATVTLVPESFMGGGVTASGETNEDGMCSVTGEDGKVGAIPGIYKVEVTHPDYKISPKYNEETQLSTALDTTNPYAQTGVPEFRVK